MVRFNIIGYGFLNVADPSGVAFKAENPFFRFADISLGRSTEFSVPATDHNRQMLGFSEEPAETGEMLRRVFPAQMVYDGGVVNGTIAVTGFASEAFTCVFTVGNADWIDALQNRKLSDCISSFDKGVTWANNSVIVDADAADPTLPCQIIRYENGYAGDPSQWMLVPSINVYYYLDDILTNLGIPHTLAVPKELWMVAGSLKGGNRDDVILTQTDYSNFGFSQVQDYIEVVDIDLEWATANVFGALIGGGSSNAKAFRARQDLKATFPTTIPSGTTLVQWNSRLRKCANIATHPAFDIIQELNGATLTIKKGTVFFLADRMAGDPLPYYGWKTTDIPALTATVTMERDGDLTLGEVWYMRNNHPDMTVFEYLKSVCVATGLELIVDGETGVDIVAGHYGRTTDFAPLERVVSLDSVTRRVESWGNGTRRASTSFDSDDYVTEPLVTSYEVDNEQQQEGKDTKAKFSEGNVGTNGILIEDVDGSSNPPKLKAKRWTLARSTSSSTYLQRVELADPVGYEDIAVNSTAVQVRLAAQLDEFFELKPSKTWTWRGSAFVWTDASWSDGILTLTLQRVSQPNASAEPTPPPELTDIKAQFDQGGAVVVGTDSLDTLKQYLTVTATYSDSSTRVLSGNEYTLSGTLAYPSATITAECQGVTDTFAVAVAYDAEVEYLQSTGTQYIDTGIKPHKDIEVEIKWKNNSTQYQNWLLGSGSSNTDCIRVYVSNPGTWRFGGGSASINVSNTTTRVATINKSKVTINGYDYSWSGTVGTFSSNVTVKIFAGATFTSPLSARLYYFIATDNGVQIADLIPVRCGTTGYMYDRVSGTLFGNDGTGDFVVGADV